jgi:ERCC4-related helicase
VDKLKELLEEHFCNAEEQAVRQMSSSSPAAAAAAAPAVAPGARAGAAICGLSDHAATRVIVFCNQRDSVSEVVAQLSTHETRLDRLRLATRETGLQEIEGRYKDNARLQLPTKDKQIRPHRFVGQGDSALGGTGLRQDEQSDVVRRFQLGEINTLVSTSIGEEGLDIGQVDLIVFFDQVSSATRLQQRAGRTGRHRAGRVVLLCSEGKEADRSGSAAARQGSIQHLLRSAGTDRHIQVPKNVVTRKRFPFRCPQTSDRTK